MGEMKSKPLTSIIVLMVITSTLFIQTLAQSNNSLEWGVNPGDEFTYVLQRAYFEDEYNRPYIEAQLPFLAVLEPGQKVFLEVDHLESIENMINESSQLPRSYCNLLRTNDSAVIITNLTSLVIPIGDWDFLAEVENITGTDGISLVDTEEEWGTIGIGTIPGGSGDATVRVEMRFEKDNGTLSYLRHRYTYLGNDIIDVIFVHWYPGIPTIVRGGIQTTTLLIIAMSGIIGLIIAFIVYRGIKSKKSMAQRLGE
jgi:hypothetical protein